MVFGVPNKHKYQMQVGEASYLYVIRIKSFREKKLDTFRLLKSTVDGTRKNLKQLMITFIIPTPAIH